MVNFYLYDFSFDRADQRNCLSTGAWQKELKHAREYLQEGLPNLFTTKVKKKKNGESERLDNSMEHSEGYISLFVLCNNKNLGYKEKMEKMNLPIHPGCWVIIDNRPDKMLMAIANSDAFYKDPEKVRLIMEQAMNRIMDQKELKVEIRQIPRDGQFFDIVDKRLNVEHDTISWLKMEVPSEAKIAQMGLKNKLKETLSAFNTINRMVNAPKGLYTASSSKKEGLKMSREEGMVELVTSVIMSGYVVSVKFKKSGVVNSSKLDKWIEPMDEKILDNFRNGVKYVELDGTCSGSLDEWFDKVKKSIENAK